MNKLLTITAIVIMLLLQYSRQAYYIYCKIENISAVYKCDCEKVMEHSDKDDHNGKEGRIPVQAVPDEWFCSSSFAVPNIPVENLPSTAIAADPSFYCQLFIKTLLQPPIV